MAVLGEDLVSQREPRLAGGGFADAAHGDERFVSDLLVEGRRRAQISRVVEFQVTEQPSWFAVPIGWLRMARMKVLGY